MARLTHQDLDNMELRADKAESVKLPIDKFLQLIAAARNGLRPQLVADSKVPKWARGDKTMDYNEKLDKSIKAKVAAMNVVKEHGPYNPGYGDQVDFIEVENGGIYGVWRWVRGGNWSPALSGPFKTLDGAKSAAEASVH